MAYTQTALRFPLCFERSVTVTTIKEVAQACGLSQATVSQVLGGGSRPVSTRTREHILKMARTLDYRPNAVARGLTRKRMNTLGLALLHSENFSDANPFLMLLLDGMLAVTTRRSQSTMLCTVSRWQTAEHLPVLSDGRCDGVLLLIPPNDCALFDILRRRKVPFVVVNAPPPAPGDSWVDVDNVRAAREMTEYLLALGHRRIAFVRDEFHLSYAFMHERHAGYRQAMTEAGVYDPALDGCTRAQAVALAPPATGSPTAFFCLYDMEALALMAELQRLGLRVPEDVSVAGFDDIPAAASSRPALTTARQPVALIGQRAAERLLLLIEEGSDRERDTDNGELLPAELIVRASTGPPRPV